MCGPLAQSVEQFPFKEWVASSNLAGLTRNYEKNYKIFHKSLY